MRDSLRGTLYNPPVTHLFSYFLNLYTKNERLNLFD